MAEMQFVDQAEKETVFIEYQNYVEQQTIIVTDSLTEEKIPKQYHDAVKKYFDKVKE